MTSSNLIGFMMALGLLVGCSFGKNDKPAGGIPIDSTLDIETIQVESVDNGPVNDYDFVSERAYHLRTCLSDKLKLHRWGGQVVTITGGNLNSPPVTTDANGCFVWTEKVGPFRQLAKEHYITLEREVTMLTRKLSVRYAINPWLKEAGFSDLTAPKRPSFPLVVEAQAAEALLGVGEFAADAFVKPPQSNLRVNDQSITLNYLSSEDKRIFNATVRLNLSSQRLGYDGSNHFENLTKGRFKVRLVFKVKNLGADATVVDEVSLDKPLAIDPNGQITGHAEVRLPNFIDHETQVFAEYHVQAQEAAVGFLPNQGSIQLDSNGANYQGDKKHAHQLVAVAEAVSPPIPALPENADSQAPYLISKRFITRSGDIGYDPSRWEKEIQVHSQVCPETNTNPTWGMRNKDFRVELSSTAGFNSGSQVISLADDGCLHWNQNFKYPIASPIKPITVFMVVQALSTPYENTAVQVKEFQLNFWEETLARDVARQGHFPENHNTDTATLNFKEANYLAENSQFEIDKYLQLFRLYHFKLLLEPQLFQQFRYQGDPVNATSGVNPNFKMPVGSRFAVEAVLAGRPRAGQTMIGSRAEASLPSEYLAHFTSEGKVLKAGQVEVPMLLPFLFTHIYRLKAQTKLYVRIRPLGSQAPGEKIIAFNLYVPLPAKELIKGLKVDEGADIEQRFNQLWVHAQTVNRREIAFAQGGKAYVNFQPWPLVSAAPAKTASPLDIAVFLGKRANSLVTISLDGSIPDWSKDFDHTDLSTKAKLSADELTPLVNGAVRINDESIRERDVYPTLSKFCSLYLFGNRLSECTRKPDNYFEATRFVVLTEDPRFRVEKSDFNVDITFNATFSRPISTDSRIHDAQKNAMVFENYGFSSSLGVDSIAGGKVHSGSKSEDEFFLVREILYNYNLESDVNVNTSKNAWGGQGITFELVANRQECLMVRPMNKKIEAAKASTYFICQAKKNKTFHETWYEFDERAPNVEVLLAGSANLEEQGYFKLIRGELSYQEYKLRIAHNTVAYAFDPVLGFLTGPKHPREAEKISINDVPRFFDDGGIGAGVTEKTIMRSKSLWLLTELDSEINYCVFKNNEIKYLKLEKLLKMSNWCRCNYEHIAQRWSFQDFQKNIKQYSNELLEIKAYCEAQDL